MGDNMGWNATAILLRTRAQRGWTAAVEDGATRSRQKGSEELEEAGAASFFGAADGGRPADARPGQRESAHDATLPTTQPRVCACLSSDRRARSAWPMAQAAPRCFPPHQKLCPNWPQTALPSASACSGRLWVTLLVRACPVSAVGRAKREAALSNLQRRPLGRWALARALPACPLAAAARSPVGAPNVAEAPRA